MIGKSGNLAENKLFLLFLLYNLNIPLTNSKLTQIVMENNWMNYFDFQQYLSELQDTELIKPSDSSGKNLLVITEKGVKTLELFEEMIPESKKISVMEYVKSNKFNLRNEAQIISDYKKADDNQYIVNCKVIENSITLLELSLNVVSSSQAKEICRNWHNKATIIYSDLINKLTEQ